MQAFYDKKPSTIEAVGNGSYRYRFNITEVNTPVSNEEETQAQWSCDEVIIWELSSNKITEAVINELWDSNYEQKLVNEYNAAQLGVYDETTSATKVESYKTFLSERNTVKSQVDKDCAELGIR